MISECPNCNQSLNLSDAHKEKLITALNQLTPGRTLKFGCPKCKAPIELSSDGTPASKEKPGHNRPPVIIEPPRPQDIKWLASGELKNDQLADNIPTAMVLMPEDEIKLKITKSLEENRYQLYSPNTVDDAVNSLRFRNFAVVVYHSEYENCPLKDQSFHRFMKQMSMSKRRAIYYILISPKFQTLSDLEALTFSANLVINIKEIPYFSTIFKKGKTDLEALFSKYADTLKKYGKN